MLFLNVFYVFHLHFLVEFAICMSIWDTEDTAKLLAIGQTIEWGGRTTQRYDNFYYYLSNKLTFLYANWRL